MARRENPFKRERQGIKGGWRKAGERKVRFKPQDGEWQTVTTSPFDDNVLEDMQKDFDTWGNKARYNTFREKKLATDYTEYKKMVNILGNVNFVKLKEAQYLDSNQVIDIVQNFSQDASQKDIERALVEMIVRINNIEGARNQALFEALEAGFSVKEAIEYAELTVDDLGGFNPNASYSDLVSEIQQQIGKNNEKERIRDKLKNKVRFIGRAK